MTVRQSKELVLRKVQKNKTQRVKALKFVPEGLQRLVNIEELEMLEAMLGRLNSHWIY